MIVAGVLTQPEITGTLDERIRDAVMVLRAGGIDTFASCEGGQGHMFRLPTIRFKGDEWVGRLAVSLLAKNGYAVNELTHNVADANLSSLTSDFWQVILAPEITRLRLRESIAVASEKNGWRTVNGSVLRYADWSETIGSEG